MDKVKKYLIIIVSFIICSLFTINIKISSNLSSGNFEPNSITSSKKMTTELRDKYLKIMIKSSKGQSISYLNSILDELSKYEIRDLLLAISIEESYLDSRAKSKKNARGLTQVLPYTEKIKKLKNGKTIIIKDKDVWEKELIRVGIITKVEDLYDPIINIKAGNYVLMKYIFKYKNFDKALLRYSGGLPEYPKMVKQRLGTIVCETYNIDTEKYLMTIENGK